MGFVEFDGFAAYDPAPLMDAIPRDDKTRALFYDNLRRAYDGQRVPCPDFPRVPFAQVERHAFNQAMLDACATLWPDRGLAASLFEIGRGVYPHFASTMVGKAIFSVAGRDYVKMATLSPRAYSVANERGTVEVLRADPGHVHARFTDLWDFPPYVCGVWHGGLDVCEHALDALEIDQQAHGTFELRVRYS
ncbi:MAG: DUF2378 family protein [Myxococcota bacterium]